MPDIEVSQLDEDAVLKEVWNTSEIEAKTELSVEQIESVNKLKTLSEIFGSELLDSHLRSFMTLQKSKERKSMDEFVNVVSSKRADVMNKGKGFFSQLLG